MSSKITSLKAAAFDAVWSTQTNTSTEGMDGLVDGETPDKQCPRTLLRSKTLLVQLAWRSAISSWTGNECIFRHPIEKGWVSTAKSLFVLSDLTLKQFLMTFNGIVGPEHFAYAMRYPEAPFSVYIAQFELERRPLPSLIEGACCMVNNHLAWSHLAKNLNKWLLCGVEQGLDLPQDFKKTAIYGPLGEIYVQGGSPS